MNQADKERLLANFECNPPANASSIRQFETAAGLHLPECCVQFLQEADGGQGFIGNAYLILWRVEELLEMNNSYEVAEYAPGLFLFGSDGGGEALAFDTRSDKKPIVSVPFVGMELKLARPVASNFNEFLKSCTSSELSTATANDMHGTRVRKYAGKEIFEIQPVILSGSPTDPRNKVILNRQQHIEAVRYWNNIIREIREAEKE